MVQENEMLLIEDGLKNLLYAVNKETKLIYPEGSTFYTSYNGFTVMPNSADRCL